MRALWILIAVGCAADPPLGEHEAESLIGFVPPAHNGYKISNINSGRCLGVDGTQFADGENVNQYTCAQTGLQMWSVFWDGTCSWCARIHTGDGWCLEGGTNARLHIHTCSAFRSDQLFVLNDPAEWAGFHMIQLRDRTSAQCVDVPNGSVANGERVNMFNCNGAENQTWLLEPLSELAN